jgi:hypothetical protein
MSFGIPRASLDEHPADAVAACHNLGTAHIHPLTEIGIYHRRTAAHAIPTCLQALISACMCVKSASRH